MATLQDYLGITSLRDAWPKWKANVIAVNNQVINHVAGTADKHAAQDITYTGDFAGKAEVKAALDQAKTEIDLIVVSASIDPEVAFARTSAVKSKVFGSLDARFEEDEQDLVTFQADTTTQLNSMSINVLYPPIGLNPIVGDDITDDTIALQAMLNYFPDNGGVLLIPQSVVIRITAPLIVPTITNGTSIKPITISGLNSVPISGTIDGWSRGVSAFHYVGITGACFDLCKGDNSNINAKVCFKNISIYGEALAGTYGIRGYSVTDSQFDNILVKSFDIGILVHGSLYYCKFDTVHLMYNSTIGLSNILGPVNHTTFFRCKMSSNGSYGAKLVYPSVGCDFFGCWFESNTIYGLELQHGTQCSIINCYFEGNGDAGVDLIGSYLEPKSVAIVQGCHFSAHSVGHIKIVRLDALTLIGNSFHGVVSSYSVAINTALTSQLPYVVTAIGNTFDATISTFRYYHGSFTLTRINDGDQLGIKTNIGKALFKEGIGVGNAVTGDITATAKTKKLEIFDDVGISLGFIQMYAGA